MNHIYIIECEDGTLSTGWTNNLEKRFAAHCAGKGAKYTKSHKPKAIVYTESFDTPQLAMAREYQIKHMSRKKKLDLIASYRPEEGASSEHVL